jgi:hypothetical protein
MGTTGRFGGSGGLTTRGGHQCKKVLSRIYCFIFKLKISQDII